MGGQLADLIVTDPPYGMSYGGGRAAGSSKGARVKAHGMIKNDDAQGDDLVQTCAGRGAMRSSGVKTRRNGLRVLYVAHLRGV